MLLSFLFINKSLRVNNLKTRIAMNAKISVFVICVEVIVYLSLCNLHDCTFNLIFLIKPFFYTTEKSRQKFKCLKNGKSFQGEIKIIFIIFKGLSVAKNYLRTESAPLNTFGTKMLIWSTKNLFIKKVACLHV